MVKKTNMQEVYHNFRQSGIIKFTEYLDKREKCAFCKEKCGHPWCPVEQEEEEQDDE